MSHVSAPHFHDETAAFARKSARPLYRAARELGVYKDEATFKAKLAAIARRKVKDEPAKINLKLGRKADFK